jgi:hypothetical protein
MNAIHLPSEFQRGNIALAMVTIYYFSDPDMKAAIRGIDQITVGGLSDGRVAQFDGGVTGPWKITFNSNNDFSGSSSSMRELIRAGAHESRHAQQVDKSSTLEPGSREARFYNDTVFCEWDAYRYEGNFNDQLNLGGYGISLTHYQRFCQQVDLMASYTNYDRCADRYFSWWGPGGRGDYNTEDKYRNNREAYKNNTIDILTESEYY